MYTDRGGAVTECLLPDGTLTALVAVRRSSQSKGDFEMRKENTATKRGQRRKAERVGERQTGTPMKNARSKNGEPAGPCRAKAASLSLRAMVSVGERWQRLGKSATRESHTHTDIHTHTHTHTHTHAHTHTHTHTHTPGTIGVRVSSTTGSGRTSTLYCVSLALG
jgi:hypothetical protein